MSFDGSTRCRAPRSWTATTRCGQRRTSAPVAPAWSRWMCVSRIARGTRSPSASHERRLAGLRARVDEHVADAVAADDVRAAEVQDVDLLVGRRSQARDEDVRERRGALARRPGPVADAGGLEAGFGDAVQEPFLVDRARPLRRPRGGRRRRRRTRSSRFRRRSPRARCRRAGRRSRTGGLRGSARAAPRAAARRRRRASSHWRWSCITTTSKVASGNGSTRSSSSRPATGANVKSGRSL